MSRTAKRCDTHAVSSADSPGASVSGWCDSPPRIQKTLTVWSWKFTKCTFVSSLLQIHGSNVRAVGFVRTSKSSQSELPFRAKTMDGQCKSKFLSLKAPNRRAMRDAWPLSSLSLAFAVCKTSSHQIPCSSSLSANGNGKTASKSSSSSHEGSYKARTKCLSTLLSSPRAKSSRCCLDLTLMHRLWARFCDAVSTRFARPCGRCIFGREACSKSPVES
mmetsp:Transcript_7764/g.25338  ORF Transcript_7764/g.25338 Transcript_7764/m.25338 type:complete len:218 (-) Transcript_7764:59-712(-)